MGVRWVFLRARPGERRALLPGGWVPGDTLACKRRRWPVLDMRKAAHPVMGSGLVVETLVPQSEGYTMTGTDASTGKP